MKKFLALMVMTMFLTGCSGVDVADYAERSPKLDLRQYFNGDVIADGAFFNRSGKIEKQFHVVMRGSWQGNNGKLEEDFVYSDGTKSHRTWTVAFQDDNHFTGTAPDVVGTAVGEQRGNASHMKYVLRLPVKDTTYDVSMDDWLYRLSDTVMINRVAMTKFGFKVGELVITFHKK